MIGTHHEGDQQKRQKSRWRDCFRRMRHLLYFKLQAMTAQRIPAQARHALSVADDTRRLAKHLAATHSLSRSQAEAYIEGGYVRVNDTVIESPQHRVKGTERIVLDTQAKLTPNVPMTILWHKPAGIACEAPLDRDSKLIGAASRSGSDRSGIRFVQRHLKDQICATPLETGASGLVVLTQDFPVKRKLIQDRAVVEHEVIVEVQHNPKLEASEALLDKALRTLSRDYAKVTINKQTDTITGLRFAVKGYEAGQTAAACVRVGLEVEAMKRLRIGRMPLAGLDVGQWRFLMGYERF